MVELAIRGKIVDFSSDLIKLREYDKAFRYYDDGILCMSSGKVVWCGSWEEGKQYIDVNTTVRHYCDDIIMPGFVDTHVHYPQLEAISSYGEQLLEWLESYTFRAEMKFSDSAYCRTVAKLFLSELLANGTTSSLVFGTVHPQSVDALFDEASKLDVSIIAGKVWMDRNAPSALTMEPEESYRVSEELIKKWHNNGRNKYAVTPRFAPTSSNKELMLASMLHKKYPDTYVHTHLCENRKEVEWVKDLFPECTGYLDVYQHYGLTGPRTVFAHSIYLSEDEWEKMKCSDSRIAFCPTSNLFLGSGLFDLKKALQHNIKVGLGTDVGAGTSLNMLQTLNEAYKICQLKGDKLSPLESLYLATLGGAKALNLEHEVGNFDVGKFADFVVMTPAITPIQHWRLNECRSIDDVLFMLFMMGDDRNVKATYVNGKLRYGS